MSDHSSPVLLLLLLLSQTETDKGEGEGEDKDEGEGEGEAKPVPNPEDQESLDTLTAMFMDKLQRSGAPACFWLRLHVSMNDWLDE